MSTQRPDIGVYYFPGYHTEPRMEADYGAGFTEWKLVREAKPRYDGHRQPRVPVWGAEDEADPTAMAKRIDAAADHGVDVFLFDWYWYGGRPFLERALNDGYLGAANRGRLKFALMWANHDWRAIFPAEIGKESRIMYPGVVSPAEWDSLCDHIVGDYFSRPEYYRVDGGAYFSIYDLDALFRSFGGAQETKRALDQLRERAEKAGAGALHLNAVVWGKSILPGTVVAESGPRELVECGFDSATSYVWVHHADLGKAATVEYMKLWEQYARHWDTMAAVEGLPYYPNVSVGWDSTPRTHQGKGWDAAAGYPYTPVIQDASPALFRRALDITKARAAAEGTRLVTINAWNEWTEGSYLEPDTEHGMGYLEAIRDAFGQRTALNPESTG